MFLVCSRFIAVQKIVESSIGSVYYNIALFGDSGARRTMTDVTRILNAIEQGDTKAADELLPLVYNELRRLAAQQMAEE